MNELNRDRARDLERWAKLAMARRDVHGLVKISAWKRGKLLWTRERPNVFCTSGLGPIAQLAGGMW